MKFFNVFTSFFTGASKDCYLANLNGRKFNSLYSYYYLQNNTEEEIIDGFSTNTGEIFIDSGAFTAWSKDISIDVEKYINWINKYDEYVSAFGQIDAIPPRGSGFEVLEEYCQKTWQNYLYMIDRVKSPKKILYTFHFGESFEWLKKALEFRFPDGSPMEYMAFGGLVGRTTQERVLFLNRAFEIVKNSSNPNIKIHGFGVSSKNMWTHYPFYSCDSYTPGFNATYGYTFNEFGAYREPDYKKHFKPKKPDTKGALFKTMEVKAYEDYEEMMENATEEEKRKILLDRQMNRSKLLTDNIEYWTNLAESIGEVEFNPINRIIKEEDRNG